MNSPEGARRVALVGIDGAGKSAVLAALREAARGQSVRTMTCPDFHDTADAPLQHTSQALKRFSQGSDHLGSAELKALAMYLQMTLYGPVERFFLDTAAPQVLVSERHPLVETFVYGKLYQLLAGADPDTVAAAAHQLESALDAAQPGTHAAVTAWHDAECRRLGRTLTLAQRFHDVADALNADFPSAMAEFGRRYRTRLPDVVLWLDAPADDAARRCAARGTPGEVHETVPYLSLLRQQYAEFAEQLTTAFPSVVFRTISTGTGVDLATSVQACITEGRVFR